jgi:hypothetical protein
MSREMKRAFLTTTAAPPRAWWFTALVALAVSCGDPNEKLGRACGSSCAGAWCVSTGTDVEEQCGSVSCAGVDSMYCSRPCGRDSDCQGGTLPMRCLVECAALPAAAGHCVTNPDWKVLRERVCVPTEAPTGGAVRDAGDGEVPSDRTSRNRTF